jgi:thiol-disulfide isomerase/thioredoxin
MTDQTKEPPRKAGRVGAIVAALCVLGLAGVLYVRTPLATKVGPADCSRSSTVARKIVPLEIGDIAAMTPPAESRPMPALAFEGPDGKPVSLAAFRGRTILLNLWATWCVPCRAEMPALDKLQAQFGDKPFEVVTVNIDTTRLEKVKSFLGEVGVAHLAYYADPKAEIFYTLKQAGRVTGLPTSYLIGSDGCEIGTLAGPANWTSDDALSLIKGAIAAARGGQS